MISRLDIAQMEHLFGSRTRAALLAKLLQQPSESFYLRELSKELELAFSAVHREMENLERLGLVLEERRGRERFFCVNRGSPVARELRRVFICYRIRK
ncbi:MAG: winged helix-turn-helix domain-containing protein [Candidatus Micrarchaeota archaeon]